MNKRTAALGGLVLGGLVVLLQVVAVGAGLDTLFPLLATAVEIGVLVAVLWRTRSEQSYGQQLGAGVLATLVSLPLVAAGFLLSVRVLFPGSVPDEQLVPQGMAGLIGTLVTGVVVSAVAASFLRVRS